MTEILSKVTSVGLKFEEAIKYFKNKVVLSKEDFLNLEDRYKRLAFTISNYSNIQIINQVYEELLKSLEDGLTVEDFKNNLNEFLQKRGYDILNKYQAEVIFRNNIQTAYQAGHYEQMTDKEVLKDRPFWQYDAVLDEVTRPEHKALDGKVFKADDPFWDIFYPPNGFGCRCSVKALSKRNMESKNLKIEKGENIDIVPDKNFNTKPTEMFKPDLKDLPLNLQKAYENQKL